MPDGTDKELSTQAQRRGAKPPRRRTPGLMALEPRLMYDGAAAVSLAAAATSPTHAALSGSASGHHGHGADATSLSDASDPSHAAVVGATAPPATGPSETHVHEHHQKVTQLVFIDSSVPDYQILEQGVQPGVKVVILNSDSDGMQQIADYLQQHHFQNLDAISIVGHGTTDELALGNDFLTAADAPSYAAQLAVVGQALKPGGDLLLYGCDVAQVNNDPLLGELAAETGGATVAASSHLVGASAQGGSWNLDISTGAVSAATPFTAAALQAYPDLLIVSSSLLWYTANDATTASTGIFHTVAGGTTNESNTITGVATDAGSTVIDDGFGLAVDGADGYYFVVNNNGGIYTILRGQVGSSSLTTIYTSGAGADEISAGADPLNGLAYDPVNGTLYFAQEDSGDGSGLTTTDTGIYALAHANQATVGSVSQVVNLNSGTQQVNEIALDTTHNLLFFTDGLTDQTTVNDLEVANLTTGSVLNSDLASATLNSTQTMSGVTVDPTTDTILWTVTDSGSNSGNTIHSATYSTGATPTLSNVTTLYSGSSELSTGQAPFDIAIDGSAFYVLTSETSSAATAQILEGNVSGSGSLTVVDTPIQSNSTDTDAYALTLEAQPTVVANGSATATEGQPANTIDSGITVSTVNGAELDGATVTVTNAKTGDALGIGSSSDFTVNGITITFDATNSSGGHDTLDFSGAGTSTLTLTGIATAAEYQDALAAVTFSSTSTDVTTRTVDWIVNDKFVASGASPSTVLMGPAVAPSGATATFDGGGSAVKLDPNLSVGDGSSADLASATITIASGFLTGDTLSVNGVTSGTVDGITVSYDSADHDLVLSGSATVATYKTVLDEVEYSVSPANTDPTAGGTDTSRTIDWVVSDGTLTSTVKTSTLDTVHTAPTMSASGTVTFDGGGSPVTLDNSAAVTDSDSGGNLAGATVQITNTSFVSGDTLSVNGVTNGTVDGINVSYNSGSGVLTLSNSASINTYNTVLDEVQYSFSPSNGDPTAGGGHTSRTIDWSANDGSSSNGGSNTATSTLDTVHVAPSLTVGTPSVNYTAGGSATVLDTGLTVSDVDSAGNLAGATVTISSGFLTGDTLAATTSGTSITATFNSSTHQLVLSGSDTFGHYQQVLDSVAYSSSATDPTNAGADASRTISWLVNDGSTSNGTASGTTSLGVHLGPAITAGATVTYDSGGTAVPLDSGLTISDGASTTIASATVAISSGALAGDTLSFNNDTNTESFGDGATVSATFASNSLTLTTTAGTASVADYQTALDSVTYSSSSGDVTNAGADLTRTITWTANDGTHVGSATSTLDARTPPVVSAGTPSGTFIVGGAPVVADSGLTLNDFESTTLSGATVSIAGGSFASGDTLAFTNTTHITGSYNAATGMLTLSGSDTVMNYQAALDSITFSTSSTSTTDLSRTIDWGVTDGLAASNTAATALTVDVPPTVGSVSLSGGVEGGTPAALSAAFTEANTADTAGDFSGTIAWGDGTTSNFTSAAVSGSNGSFTVSGQHVYAEEGNYTASVTINDNSGGSTTESGSTQVADAPLTAGTVSVTASTEQISSASLTATFTDANTGAPTSDFSGTINWGDGNTANFTSAQVLALGPGNFEVTGVSHQYAEEGNYTASVTITDVGGSTTIESGSASVADAPLTAGTVTANGGAAGVTAATLSATFTDANPVSPTSDFSGTVNWGDGNTANFTSAEVVANGLGSFTVSGLSHLYALSGNYTTTVTIDDTGGSTTTDTGTATVTHVAPTVTAGGSATFIAGGAAVTLDGTASVSDPDSGNLLQSATVSIAGGSFVAGDTLDIASNAGFTLNGAHTQITFTDGDTATIAGAGSGGNGTLTLTGAASVSDYALAFDSVTYSSSAADPTVGGTDTSRTIDWSANDGDSGNGASNIAVSSLTVHTPPVVAVGAAGTLPFTAGGTAVTADANLSVSDIDSGGQLTGATVTISGGFLSGDVLAASTGATGITAAYSSGTGVLTLSGTASIAFYDQVLDSVTFSSSGADITSGGADHTRTLTWQASDALSSSNAPTTSVTVDAPPVVTPAATTPTYIASGTATVLNPGLTVSDSEATEIAGATVEITNAQSGDVLGFNNGQSSEVFGDGTITASFSGSTLTLSGTASVSDYQTALQSVAYSSTSTDPTVNDTATSRQISWQVTDVNGAVQESSSPVSSTLDVHTPPVVAVGAAGTLPFTAGGSAVTADANLSVSDIDSGGQLTGATVTISGGFLSGDVLAASTGATGITAAYNSGTGVLTLSGTAGIAFYDQVLDSVTFSSSGADITSGGTDHTRTLTWQASDALSSSNAPTTSLTILQPPVVTAGGSASYLAGGSGTVLDGGLSITDSEATQLQSATVSIADPVSGDTLSVAASALSGTGISAAFAGSTLTLSGDASVATYQSVLEAVSFSSTIADPTGAGVHESRTIDWSVTDINGSFQETSNTATSNLSVNSPPVVGAGADVLYNAGGPAVTLDGTLTATPVETTSFASATVSIAGGTFLAGDQLNFTNTSSLTDGNISVQSDSNGVLVLTSVGGTASATQWQNALEQVTYSSSASDPSNNGTDTSRSIDWVVNDGTVANVAATSTVEVNGPPPTISGTTGFVGEYVQQQPTPAVLDNTVTVTDVDSTTLTGATVSISSGFLAGDTLAATTAGTGITASYNAASGVLTLSGSDTIAHYDQVLDAVTYTSSATDPTNSGADFDRTISWQVQDGRVANNVSSVATSQLDTHVRPVVVAGATADFDQGGTAVVADATVTASDADTNPILSATVAITGGFVAGDTLAFNNGTNTESFGDGTTLSSTFSGGSLVLTQTVGFSSAADFQAALRTVSYVTASTDPTSSGADPTRTLTWTLNTGDASQTSTAATSTIDVFAPPVLSNAGNTVSYTQGGGAETVDGSLAITDFDSTSIASATVSIGTGFLAGDTLNFTNTAAITGSYNSATGTLTLTGSDSVTNYQAALDSVTFSFSGVDPTAGGTDSSRTVSWVVNDGHLASAAATSTVDTPHVAPVAGGGGNSIAYTHGDVPVSIDPGLTVSDVDSATLVSATVVINNGFFTGDQLNFTSQNGITGSYDPLHGLLFLNGTASLADYQAALRSITYSFTGTDPSINGTDQSRVIDWVVNDGSQSNNLSTAVSTTIDTAHVAPVVGGAGNSVTYTAGSAPIAVDGGLTVSDVDSTTLASATVSISGGSFVAGDQLTFTNQGGISGSYDAATGKLTLTGSASVGSYQTALDSITYSFSGLDPSGAGANLSRTVSWVVNDGAAAGNLSTPVTTTIDTPHLAPVVTTGSGTTVESLGLPVPVYDTTTVTDIDSTTLVGATVAITNGHLTGDTLDLDHGANSESFSDGKTITASFVSSSGVLTLSGTASVADYQQALRDVEFSTASPLTSTRTISETVQDPSISHGVSAPATRTVQVEGAVGAPPVPPPQPPQRPPEPPHFGPPLPPFQPPGLPPLPEPPGVVFGPLPSFGGPTTLAGLEPGAGGGEFVALLDGIPDFTANGDQHFEFAIPRDAFIATAGDSGIGFAASLADGHPLPPWLSFDNATGEFVGNPPPDASGTFTIEVLVHDAGGHTAAASFHLTVGQGHAAIEPVPPPAPHAASEAPATHAALAPRDLGLPGRSHLRLAADNDRWHDKDARHQTAFGAEARHIAAGFAGGDGHGPGAGEALPAGKPGLSAQLRAAGRHGFASERQALLDSLQRRAAG